jgi:hypothetical protein
MLTVLSKRTHSNVTIQNTFNVSTESATKNFTREYFLRICAQTPSKKYRVKNKEYSEYFFLTESTF